MPTNRGMRWWLNGAVIILGALASGVALQETEWGWIALVALLLYVLGVLFWFQSHRLPWRRKSRRLQELEVEVRRRGLRLTQLRNIIIDDLAPVEAKVDLWREDMVVKGKGDTETVWTLIIRVLGEHPLHFWRFKLWGEPLSIKQRQQVRPIVRMGPGGGELDTQIEWEDGNGTCIVYADFPEPIQPNGEPFQLNLECLWPRTLGKLAAGGTERVLWKIPNHKPVVRFEFSIAIDCIPSGKQLTYVTQRLAKTPTPRVDDRGRWTMEAALEPPPTDAEFGLILNTKPKG